VRGVAAPAVSFAQRAAVLAPVKRFALLHFVPPPFGVTCGSARRLVRGTTAPGEQEPG